MDVVLGFGARTAARVLRAVASVINPPEKHPVVTSGDYSSKESGVLIPKSIVAQQEVVVIDNKTILMASANLDDTVVTQPDSEVVSGKRKSATSPLFCPCPRCSTRTAPTAYSNVCGSQFPNLFVMGLPFVFEQMGKVWMEIAASQRSILINQGTFDKE